MVRCMMLICNQHKNSAYPNKRPRWRIFVRCVTSSVTGLFGDNCGNIKAAQTSALKRCRETGIRIALISFLRYGGIAPLSQMAHTLENKFPNENGNLFALSMALFSITICVHTLRKACRRMDRSPQFYQSFLRMATRQCYQNKLLLSSVVDSPEKFPVDFAWFTLFFAIYFLNLSTTAARSPNLQARDL